MATTAVRRGRSSIVQRPQYVHKKRVTITCLTFGKKKGKREGHVGTALASTHPGLKKKDARSPSYSLHTCEKEGKQKRRAGSVKTPAKKKAVRAGLTATHRAGRTRVVRRARWTWLAANGEGEVHSRPSEHMLSGHGRMGGKEGGRRPMEETSTVFHNRRKKLGNDRSIR